MDYQTFKNEISNYQSYQRQIIKLEDKLDVLMYRMTGVSGVNNEKVRVSYNPQLSSERLLEMIEEKERLENEIKRLKMNIESTDKKLSVMNPVDKEMCIDVLARKISVDIVADRLGYSRQGIWARIKREIEKL